jgi:hypothetical protein
MLPSPRTIEMNASGPAAGRAKEWRKRGVTIARQPIPAGITVVWVLTSTCVWRVTTELILALDRSFGDPVDAYVNGSQVWLREDGPNDLMIEWRLHPVSRYERPRGVDTYDLFPDTALALATGETPPASLEVLWDGLEAFSAYGDEIEPAPLAAATTAALGIAPDYTGLVDHDVIGDAWERSRGGISIVDALVAQLSTS